ncbi:MAG: GFA family protein, partial [Burkholderiales bacterium]
VLSGSAYRVSVPAPRETFRLLTGTPKLYVKTAESGNKRWHYFCADCGTPVFASVPVDAPPNYMLRVGNLRQKSQLPPKKRIWCRSALEWSADIGGVPGHERQ